MARGLADAFAGYDVIASPSASCTAMVREYHRQLADEAGDARLARAVADRAARARPSTLLSGVLGVTDVARTSRTGSRTTATCHSLRMLRVGDAPLRLLRKVRGLELAELPAAETCCGFGGHFSVKNPLSSFTSIRDTSLDGFFTVKVLGWARRRWFRGKCFGTPASAWLAPTPRE